MKQKTKDFTIKIFGFLFFLFSVFKIMETINISATSFMYLIEGNSVIWGLFFIFTSILYILFFTYSLSSGYLLASFSESMEHKQAAWNTGIFSLIFLFIYTLVQQVTGFDIEELKYCGILFAVGLIFQIILFLFIRKDEGFNWKNIALYDRINKKCFRINIIMLVIILFGTFIYANIVLNKSGTV